MTWNKNESVLDNISNQINESQTKKNIFVSK